MKRETYKLKQLCSEIVDCVNKTAPTSDAPTPYKMLRTSDIREGKINLENLNCVTKEVYEKWTRRGKLQKGDVIFTREAPLGEVGLVREEKNYFLGQRLVLFRANDKICDGRFLMYSLLWHDNKQAIISKGVGSTVAHLRVPECENIEIKAPDLDIQHRIADILSAYDDLIENNQKQIKLLEEAAQRLYKEWFVDLHFPGHENTKIVDGVPEGWSKNPIQDFISYEIGGGWGEELQNEKSMIPAYVIRGTDIKGLVNGQLQSVPYRYHTAGSLETRKLLDGDIVFEVSGGSKTEGVARTVRIIDLMLKTWDNSVICASFCKRIKPIPSFSQYLYDSFRWMRLNGKTQEYDKKSASSIVNYRWKDFLAQEKILKPDEETISQYNNIAGTIYTKIIVCSCQIEQAKMKRDLLLPKLMSGELEV